MIGLVQVAKIPQSVLCDVSQFDESVTFAVIEAEIFASAPKKKIRACVSTSSILIQRFFFVLCFTSFVFAPISFAILTKITTIKIQRIKLNIFHTTFLIKAAVFFASSAFFAEQPEEMAIIFVVKFPAARAAVSSQCIVADAFGHAF